MVLIHVLTVAKTCIVIHNDVIHFTIVSGKYCCFYHQIGEISCHCCHLHILDVYTVT